MLILNADWYIQNNLDGVEVHMAFERLDGCANKFVDYMSI